MTIHTSRTTQASEQRYRHLFEHAPISIFVVDRHTTPPTILEANRRTALVYGYHTADLVGSAAAVLIPDAILLAGKGNLQGARHGATVTAETTLRHRDGTPFLGRIMAEPDPADANLMIVTVEDITAVKQRRSEAEAIAAERHRIAREIHDGVAQSLAGLRFKLALWSHQADDAPSGMRAALDELLDVLTAAIVDLRRAIFALRPLDLETLGFFPALAQLVNDFGAHNQLVATLEVVGQPDALAVEHELPLFRICQEGLNNIGQHAGASRVTVRIAVEPSGSVSARVHDNGHGFEPQRLAAVDRDGHFGLRQMRERVLDLGGTLDVHSAPMAGTELLVTLPPAVKGVTYDAD